MGGEEQQELPRGRMEQQVHDGTPDLLWRPGFDLHRYLPPNDGIDPDTQSTDFMWKRGRIACGTSNNPKQPFAVGVVLSHPSLPGMFQVGDDKLPRKKTQRLVEELLFWTTGRRLKEPKTTSPARFERRAVVLSRSTSPLDDVVDLPSLPGTHHGLAPDEALRRKSAANLVDLLPGPDPEPGRNLVVIERFPLAAKKVQDTFGVGPSRTAINRLARFHEKKIMTEWLSCQ